MSFLYRVVEQYNIILYLDIQQLIHHHLQTSPLANDPSHQESPSHKTNASWPPLTEVRTFLEPVRQSNQPWGRCSRGCPAARRDSRRSCCRSRVHGQAWPSRFWASTLTWTRRRIWGACGSGRWESRCFCGIARIGMLLTGDFAININITTCIHACDFWSTREESKRRRV